MHRPQSALLLALLPALAGEAVAQSQWMMVGRNVDLRLFVDRGNIVREGDIATMQQLVDYTSAQWVGQKVIMSVRNVVEYDCAKRKVRTVAGAGYSEQLMRGIPVSEERLPAAEWLEVPAGGTRNNCGKSPAGVNERKSGGVGVPAANGQSGSVRLSRA